MGDNSGQKSEIRSFFSDMIPSSGKITELKLDAEGREYLAWKKAVEYFVEGIDKADHLTTDPPTDHTRSRWIMEDRRLFVLISNTLDKEVSSNCVHCTTVKDLWDFLSTLYSGKDNLNRLYDLCISLFQPDGKGKTISQYYTEFNSIFEQWDSLLPITNDVQTMKAQREQLGALCFLLGLPSELSPTRQQILSSSEPLTRQSVFSRVLRSARELTSVSQTTSPTESSALVSSGTRGGRGGRRGRGRGRETNYICHYCKEPGHVKRTCPKLVGWYHPSSQNNPPPSRFAHTTQTSEPEPSRHLTLTKDEYNRFMQFQLSQQPSSTSSTTALI